jgi:hypothetical protein
MLGIVHCCTVGHPAFSRINETHSIYGMDGAWQLTMCGGGKTKHGVESKFVLNRICEQVDRGINLSRDIKSAI